MRLERLPPKPKPAPTTATLSAIPEGAAGVRATLKTMRRLVREGKKTLPVRQAALSVVRGLKQKDWAGQVRAVHRFVRDNIRYVKDIRGVETLTTPEKLLEIGQGDCDDKATLVAAMLESIGHPTRFVAVAFRPGIFSHVLTETLVGKRWVPLETTENVEPGWFPPGVVDRMVIYN